MECADYSIPDLQLARRILTHLGYAVGESLEPGANPRAERLAQLLHDDPRVLPDLAPVEGDLLPKIGDKVFIHLARQDQWVEHVVVGYYVWPSLHRGDTAVHRVNVRVRDSEGFYNSRMLQDVRLRKPVEVLHVPV